MALVGVCEDEPALRSVLTRALRAMGHEPLVVATAAEALRAFVRRRPDVMMLDIGLPDADGRDLCLALRAASVDSPVLFLTARDGLHDKIAGFEAGGDDYLTKPFQLDEVRVRLDALLRRTPPHAVDAAAERPVLDPGRHALVHGDAEVALTPTEFRLLGRLMAEPSTVVRRHALVAAAWPMGAMVSDNTLDSYVRRLRTKLGPLDLALITTVRGVGYRWQ
ncbi:response regulator transcription factor [Nocardioides cynanchi]|uniref:response regulator transcription factor n=1 Tax=Nocardioides cynanchi TaxID=2558918 RepID=UPI001245FBD6|nr:response regulator transcription factor [Nocardioides cynanchi]